VAAVVTVGCPNHVAFLFCFVLFWLVAAPPNKSPAGGGAVAAFWCALSLLDVRGWTFRKQKPG
jgi:hypothetical protein